MRDIERRLQTVRVKDIPEFSSWLGSRCTLLSHYGLFPYHNTEEEICEFLERTAGNPDMLNICLRSRCGEFYRRFQRGHTPFMESDPVQLEEYGGRYWVSEGKHRVCLAKRTGVEIIEAFVYPLPDDLYSLLPRIGEPGRYQAQFSYDLKEGRSSAEGSVLLLMADDIDKICYFRKGRLILDEYMGANDTVETSVKGISYKVRVAKETRRRFIFLPRTKISVDGEIAIDPDHKKTKIWLLRVPANLLDSVALYDERLYDADFCNNVRSVYRYGRWRKIDLRSILHISCLAPPPAFLLGQSPYPDKNN